MRSGSPPLRRPVPPERAFPALLDRAGMLAALLLLGLALSSAEARPSPPQAPRRPAPAAPWRFARACEVDAILVGADCTRTFLDNYLVAEGAFVEAARSHGSGLIADGFDLDPVTGRPTRAHLSSGPLVEALDVALCVKALLGNPRAALASAPDAPSRAPDLAARRLEQKIGTYERLHREAPGRGGFLPSVSLEEGGRARALEPGCLSGPDNGLWALTLRVAEHGLRQAGREPLARRFEAFNAILAGQAARVLFDARLAAPRRRVRVLHPDSPASECVSTPDPSGVPDAPHEGVQRLPLLAYLTVAAQDLPVEAVTAMWEAARPVPVETPWGTTWCGPAAPLRDEMAFLFVPLRDITTWRRLFRIRQIIRTRSADEVGLPGLPEIPVEALGGACLLHSAPPEGTPGGGGAPSPGTAPEFRTIAAFPVLLECADSEPPVASNYGAAWLLSMLRGPRMQGPLGAGEGGRQDGSQVLPVKTSEGSLPVILAACGGLEGETLAMLEKRGLWPGLRSRMGETLEAGFRDKEILELAGFAPPRADIPARGRKDYEGARPASPAP